MQSIDVSTQHDHTFRVNYSSGGLVVRIEFESGYSVPWDGHSLDWAEWERLVAWIELQRKEEALQRSRIEES